jgi:hypothetical protein
MSSAIALCRFALLLPPLLLLLLASSANKQVRSVCTLQQQPLLPLPPADCAADDRAVKSAIRHAHAHPAPASARPCYTSTRDIVCDDASAECSPGLARCAL